MEQNGSDWAFDRATWAGGFLIAFAMIRGRDGYGNESQLVAVLDMQRVYLPLVRRREISNRTKVRGLPEALRNQTNDVGRAGSGAMSMTKPTVNVEEQSVSGDICTQDGQVINVKVEVPSDGSLWDEDDRRGVDDDSTIVSGGEVGVMTGYAAAQAAATTHICR